LAERSRLANFSFRLRANGSHERLGWQPQVNYQCREGRKETGSPQTHFQGRREVPQSHAEGWYAQDIQ